MGSWLPAAGHISRHVLQVGGEHWPFGRHFIFYRLDLADWSSIPDTLINFAGAFAAGL